MRTWRLHEHPPLGDVAGDTERVAAVALDEDGEDLVETRCGAALRLQVRITPRALARPRPPPPHGLTSEFQASVCGWVDVVN
jgi:hypothetical protein